MPPLESGRSALRHDDGRDFGSAATRSESRSRLQFFNDAALLRSEKRSQRHAGYRTASLLRTDRRYERFGLSSAVGSKRSLERKMRPDKILSPVHAYTSCSVAAMIETLALKYDLPLALACSATLGYHIQMEYPRGSRSFKDTDLPPIFVEVTEPDFGMMNPENYREIDMRDKVCWR